MGRARRGRVGGGGAEASLHYKNEKERWGEAGWTHSGEEISATAVIAPLREESHTLSMHNAVGGHGEDEPFINNKRSSAQADLGTPSICHWRLAVPLTCRKMSLKKIFFLLVVICTVSLLLHNRDYLTWYKESFHVDCPLRLNSPSCQKPKHTNIVFLKTHKTASTTMQNLLFRFGERNNLTVALPIQACGHQFCYPQSFKAQFVHPHTLPANVVTNHMRFNKTALQHLNKTTVFKYLKQIQSSMRKT
ncbi:hypothetical protein OJAV_G00180390 [Oryzias javanicus]|uniref:Uncharacterized protein n=1 Tax=Oryzias javanicus TaxID=123683 RepID=A0A437CCJ1_ORYJA|nr:hypothetical protein OJAV_G00180390 [Oryzias javanicus]